MGGCLAMDAGYRTAGEENTVRQREGANHGNCFGEVQLNLRAGLKVCPERKELRLKEAILHFAGAMFFDFGISSGYCGPRQI